MAGYLVPPTKNPGDVLTSALWNSYIRDNLDFGMVRPIADSTLVGAAASIDLTSIPATFAQLVLFLSARTDAADTGGSALVRLNNDSGANYDYQQLSAGAAVASAAEAFAQTSAACLLAVGGSVTAGIFGGGELIIPNYASATPQKFFRSRSAFKTGTASGNIVIRDFAGFWRNAAVINRLTLLPPSGNFAAGTRVTLYGMGGI